MLGHPLRAAPPSSLKEEEGEGSPALPCVCQSRWRRGEAHRPSPVRAGAEDEGGRARRPSPCSPLAEEVGRGTPAPPAHAGAGGVGEGVTAPPCSAEAEEDGEGPVGPSGALPEPIMEGRGSPALPCTPEPRETRRAPPVPPPPPVHAGAGDGGDALKKLEERGIIIRFVIGQSPNQGDSLDRIIDEENHRTKDFLILEGHEESADELPWKAKFFFSSAVETWDAEYFVKVDDSINLDLEGLIEILQSHHGQNSAYVGCMKSGGVINEVYFRHAAGSLFILSKELAWYINANRLSMS